MRGWVLLAGERVELPEDAAHYVRDVLRLAVGAEIEVFDGEGAAFGAHVVSLTPCVLELGTERTATNESPCAITLYQAIPKQDRFEWVLEKTTELGVAAIVPLDCARSVVRVPAAKQAKRRERWQRICDEAARQCGRAISPHVGEFMSLREALKVSHAQRIALEPTADVSLRAALGTAPSDVALFIGPEGGFDPAELNILTEVATICRFGPRVLRAETAGVAAVTAVQLLAGALE